MCDNLAYILLKGQRTLTSQPLTPTNRLAYTHLLCALPHRLPPPVLLPASRRTARSHRWGANQAARPPPHACWQSALQAYRAAALRRFQAQRARVGWSLDWGVKRPARAPDVQTQVRPQHITSSGHNMAPITRNPTPTNQPPACQPQKPFRSFALSSPALTWPGWYSWKWPPCASACARPAWSVAVSPKARPCTQLSYVPPLGSQLVCGVGAGAWVRCILCWAVTRRHKQCGCRCWPCWQGRRLLVQHTPASHPPACLGRTPPADYVQLSTPQRTPQCRHRLNPAGAHLVIQAGPNQPTA